MSWLVLAALSWSSWVGTYAGALRWQRCTTQTASRATVELDALDGILAIALPAPLHALTFVDEGDRLEAQDGDVSVTVRATAHDTVALAIRYDSGCTITGTLARAPKSPRGWARVASHCTKDPHAAPTERALVDAGCAPNPDVALVRGSTCQQLGELGGRLARRCALPPAIARRLATTVAQLVGAAQTVDAASAPALDAQCNAALAEARRIRCL